MHHKEERALSAGHIRTLAVDIVERVFRMDAYADILLNEAFRRTVLSNQDRAFTAELVYGTLRWKGRLDWVLGRVAGPKWRHFPSRIRSLLETGLYQILFLDRVPDYASVNESVILAKRWKGQYWGNLVNAVLRQIIRNPDVTQPPDLEKDPVKSIAVGYSHPEWLVKKWLDRLGRERTLSLCAADNRRPVLSLRINRQRTTPEKMLELFAASGIDAENSGYLKEFIRVHRTGDIQQLPGFDEGYFTVQDESAGFPAYLVDPAPGEFIVDLASAPGGKATHMAELAGNRCRLVAVDNRFSRMAKVVENARRLALFNISCVVADGRSIALRRPVDKVLIDAPCTGLGTLQKRGELRWRKEEQDIEPLTRIQLELLQNGAKLVKKNGIMVYSTCTVLEEENEEVVAHFLSRNPNFTMESAERFVPESVVHENKTVRTWPDIHQMDGSFAVRLRRMA